MTVMALIYWLTVCWVDHLGDFDEAHKGAGRRKPAPEENVCRGRLISEVSKEALEGKW
jgi:hypothetical protein